MDEEEVVNILPDEMRADPYLNQTIRKVCDIEAFDGKINLIQKVKMTNERLYLVQYEDGDMEHLTVAEVERWLVKDSAPVPMAVEASFEEPIEAQKASRKRRQSTVLDDADTKRSRPANVNPSTSALPSPAARESASPRHEKEAEDIEEKAVPMKRGRGRGKSTQIKQETVAPSIPPAAPPVDKTETTEKKISPMKKKDDKKKESGKRESEKKDSGKKDGEKEADKQDSEKKESGKKDSAQKESGKKDSEKKAADKLDSEQKESGKKDGEKKVADKQDAKKKKEEAKLKEAAEKKEAKKMEAERKKAEKEEKAKKKEEDAAKKTAAKAAKSTKAAKPPEVKEPTATPVTTPMKTPVIKTTMKAKK